MTRTLDMVEIELGMSNFDYEIDEGFAEALQAGPVYGRHSAWNFNSKVWWNGTEFVAEVWQYHRPVDLVKAATLRELMDATNGRWGAD